MIFWIALAIYVIGWFLSARMINTALETADPSSDAMDRALLAAMACLIALFWPLAAPLYLVMKTRRPTAQELKKELTERKRYIAKLEKELEIGEKD